MLGFYSRLLWWCACLGSVTLAALVYITSLGGVPLRHRYLTALGTALQWALLPAIVLALLAWLRRRGRPAWSLLGSATLFGLSAYLAILLLEDSGWIGWRL